jgi:hypothetical protein
MPGEMRLTMKLFGILLFSAVALAMPSIIESRQVTEPRFLAVNSSSGSACQPGDFTVEPQNPTNRFTITWKPRPNPFNATIGGNGSNTKSCTLRINMLFPAGCRTISMRGRYIGFGFFPRTANGQLINNYAMEGGSISENNPTFEFPGSTFSQPSAAFDRSDVDIAIRVNARDDTQTLVRFVPGINLGLSPRDSATPGFLQLDSVEYRFNTAAQC